MAMFSTSYKSGRLERDLGVTAIRIHSGFTNKKMAKNINLKSEKKVKDSRQNIKCQGLTLFQEDQQAFGSLG